MAKKKKSYKGKTTRKTRARVGKTVSTRSSGKGRVVASIKLPKKAVSRPRKKKVGRPRKS